LVSNWMSKCAATPYPEAGALNEKQRHAVSTMLLGSSNSVTLEICVYLSASDLVGGAVDGVGDDTGLLSTGAPFTRPALTSANLHVFTGARFGLSRGMRHTLTTRPRRKSHHGFSLSASACAPLLHCSQLPSPFSLVRTLVVTNTDSFSPSETQTTHHLRCITHAAGCILRTS